MPRVHTRVKAARGTGYTCATCRLTIEPGQEFFYWTRRFGRSGMTYRQHKTCGYPRPTQLSSRKTAQIEEIVSSASISLSFEIPEDLSWDSESLRANHGGSFDVDTGELDTVADDIAQAAEDVASEYEESASNMPENFHGTDRHAALEDVAERLNSWASDLRDYAQRVDLTVEVPDPAEFENEELWRDAIQNAGDEKASELVTALDDLTGDMPEYEG